MDNEKVQREYERCLTKLQQNSGGYIGDEEDYHDQSKSKLFPSVSTHSATGRDADHQQTTTYIAGEIYNNPNVLSEIFPPLQPLTEEIKKDKTTDDNISLTRYML